MDKHEYDKRNLIRESYRIDGITPGQCRSIFLDWVLGAAATPPEHDQIAALLEFFGKDRPDHPMSVVLRDGLAQHDSPGKRRGGRKARVAPER